MHLTAVQTNRRWSPLLVRVSAVVTATMYWRSRQLNTCDYQ